MLVRIAAVDHRGVGVGQVEPAAGIGLVVHEVAVHEQDAGRALGRDAAAVADVRIQAEVLAGRR